MQLRWDETNVQVQCPKCNLFGQGEQYTFGLKFRQESMEKVQQKSYNKKHVGLVKLSNDDLNELIEKYKDY